METKDKYLELLPRKLQNQIMITYLFEDIFFNFKRFFIIESAEDSRFLYDTSCGFMPRNFDPNNTEDKVIYDEEEEVLEMYFITQGTIGIGYSLNMNGFLNKQHSIGLKLHGNMIDPQKDKNQKKCQQLIICDHYLLNKCKSQFVYTALKNEDYKDNCEVQGFALNRRYMNTVLYATYPKLMQKLQTDAHKLYKKKIFKPLFEKRTKEITRMNMSSTYKDINVAEQVFRDVANHTPFYEFNEAQKR